MKARVGRVTTLSYSERLTGTIDTSHNSPCLSLAGRRQKLNTCV
jgi:hypothetical protein